MGWGGEQSGMRKQQENEYITAFQQYFLGTRNRRGATKENRKGEISSEEMQN